MASIIHSLKNNAVQVDAKNAENGIREKYPLLLHESEHIELAFKGRGGSGLDKSYFTSHRILIKDGKGIGSKRKNYLSIPYPSIQAFSLTTAGTFDTNLDLKVWSTIGNSEQRIDFASGQVDLFVIQQYLNTKINWTLPQGTSDYIHSDPIDVHTDDTKATSVGSVIDWLGDNARQLQVDDVDRHFKSDMPLLTPNEIVELAFKERRDTIICTNMRLLVVDVQGLTGKKMEFKSFPWRSFSGFNVRTAGTYFDYDSEMTLYTNVMGSPFVYQDFRKNKVDLFAIQKFLGNKILGIDEHPDPNIDKKEGHVDNDKGNWFFRDNQRPLDAVEMNNYYHHNVPLLQGSETVELAFKGRRDVTLFTTKRLVVIDPQGLSGKKIAYTSVPWKSVLAFGVQTAGKHMDNDCEAILWTDMMFNKGQGDDPDTPGMAMLEVDFNKKLVDVVAIKKYLSARLLKGSPNIPVPTGVFMTSTPEKGFQKFLSKIGDDQRAVDPTELNVSLHTDNPILLDDESIIMAFKKGSRDVMMFTNTRLIVLDVIGMKAFSSGEKIKYISIPFGSIRAFSVESAGNWDRDADVDIYTRSLWELSKFSIDFRKGKADIVAIQKFLSAIVLGDHQDAGQYLESTEASLPKAEAISLGNFRSWCENNSKEVDAVETNHKLHNDPPILLSDEKVGKAYKQGRDMFVYTNKRVLLVDVQGIGGTKVQFKSLPYKWCSGFEIETAGHMDRDAEIYFHADIPSKPRTKHSILVKHHDIYEMQKYVYNILLFTDE